MIPRAIFFDCPKEKEKETEREAERETEKEKEITWCSIRTMG
jgi:hypothetical protein